MAVGKLTVSPETVRDFPADYKVGKLFIGCFVEETEKHRTHSVDGPDFLWKDSLDVTVSEGKNTLNIELVNESPNNGGIIANAKVALDQVYNLGKESNTVQLYSSDGRPAGKLVINLAFHGSNSVSSVTSSFGNMNVTGGQHASYQQTTTQSYSTSHSQSDSRQSSFSSLGPSNPVPENYGTGAPPPFTPPPAVSYPGIGGNNNMPGSNHSYVGSSTAGGLAGTNGVVDPETMSKGEFEEAKARGTIPTWAKYGGGALAGVAALGLAAWGAHEVKEHFEKKEEEDKKHSSQKDDKPFVPPAGYLQQQQQQQQHSQHNQDHQSKQYPIPPQQNCSDKGDHHKKDKKDKKKSKKHGGSGSDSSSSSSSSSDSDSSDDERKNKKHDKHHKKSDSEWR